MTTTHSPHYTSIHDIADSISIGLGTVGQHDNAIDSGVAIGQRVLPNATSLEGAVLIGSDIFPNSTSSNTITDSVYIGHSIGTNGSPGPRNVIIGATAATNLNQATDTVIVGEACGERAIINSTCVIIGASAARKHRFNTQTHQLGGGSLCLGKDCARNESSSNVERLIGADCTLLNCGSFLSTDQTPPNDTIAIGRGSLSKVNFGVSGQICLGGQNHNTFLVDVDQSIKLVTDSLVNVETTPTSTTIRATDTAETHKVSLVCGSKTASLNSVGLTVNCPILTSNGVICDGDGKSLFGIGSSKWISGRSDAKAGEPIETRRVAIGPSAYFADDDSTTRSVNLYSGEGSSDSLFPREVSASDARAYGGARVSNASESFVVIDPSSIPHGWKVTALYISFYSKTNLSAQNKTIEVFSRTREFAASATPLNSDHIILHKSGADGATANSHITLVPHFVPQGTNTLYAFLSVGSTHSVFLGGYYNIQRI